MKRITSIILVVLFCGCLSFATGFYARAMLIRHKPAGSVSVKAGFFSNYHFQPNVLNTFNNLFPIYSYQKQVCRKPFSGSAFSNDKSYFKPFSGQYKFQGFSYKTIHLGSHFLKIEGNSLFKSGNSLLLIPHSYITPTRPAIPSDIPQVLIPAK